MKNTDKILCGGCPHEERPVSSLCMRCGKGVCYECSCEITSMVTSRVVARAYIIDAGYAEERRESKFAKGFCPRCFQEETNKPDFQLLIGQDGHGKDLYIKPKKPRFFGRHGHSMFYLITYIFLIIISFGAMLFPYMEDYAKAKNAYNKYAKNKLKAERAVAEMDAKKLVVIATR